MDKPFNMPNPVVFVLTLTATGLAVARDVATLGWRVIGVDSDRSRPGCYSRHIENIKGLSDLPYGLALVDALSDAARALPVPPIVIPAADDAVQWCIQHRETLGSVVCWSTGHTTDRAGVLLDKSKFAQACKDLQIDVPLTLQPANWQDIQAFVAHCGLPCIVKPRAGHLWRQRLKGQKLLVPKDMDELKRAFDEIIGDPSAVVLQELVQGPESNLLVGAVLAGQQGGVRHVLTARKIRQFPRNFGSGSLVRSEDLADVRQLSSQIVEQLDYRGLCGTEFKRDERNGRLRLIEINPRPTLWFDLCRAAGTHLIAAHVQELAGQEPTILQEQRNATVWRYGVRDAIALMQAGPRAMLSAATAPHTDADAVFAWDDPMAGVASLGHTALQALTHLRKHS